MKTISAGWYIIVLQMTAATAAATSTSLLLTEMTQSTTLILRAFSAVSFSLLSNMDVICSGLYTHCSPPYDTYHIKETTCHTSTTYITGSQDIQDVIIACPLIFNMDYIKMELMEQANAQTNKRADYQ